MIIEKVKKSDFEMNLLLRKTGAEFLSKNGASSVGWSFFSTPPRLFIIGQNFPDFQAQFFAGRDFFGGEMGIYNNDGME